MALHRWHKLLR